MTKKHFIALADTIKEQIAYELNRGLVSTKDSGIIDSLANFCASQNPRFDRERWLGYIAGVCGKNGGKV
jgi:hypothetical protein